jgi:putative nucleotidyltransferase with HDIG domain
VTSETTQRLALALQRLQAAHTSAGLYGSDHAVIAHHTAAAHEALTQAMSVSGRVSMMRVSGRIVLETVPLPESNPTGRQFFDALKQFGVEILTFKHGCTREELGELLIQMHRGPGSASVERPASVLLGTPHILAGTLVGRNKKSVEQAQSSVHHGWTTESDSLAQVWGTIATKEALDKPALYSIVGNICTAVVGSGDLIPRLAALKRYDEYTFVHTINVGILSAAFADTLGLRKDLVYDIAVAALLHDVGKGSVPEAILNKKGSLNPEELAVMQTHPMHGARILLNVGNVPDAAVIVAYEHHMHLDGTGYPKPRRGKLPHLASQICQLADVFDALRTHRPYRQALSLEETLAVMEKGRGVKYDTDLLDIFIERIAKHAVRQLADEQQSVQAAVLSAEGGRNTPDTPAGDPPPQSQAA